MQRETFPCPKDPDPLRLIVRALVFKPAKTGQVLRRMLANLIRVWREVEGGEKVYRFAGEAAVGNFFNGLANIERSGVPNGI